VLGEWIGDGGGVATGFELVLAARVAADPLLLAMLELAALRAGAAVKLDRSAEFLLTLAGAVVGLPAFEFRFDATPLLADSGAALRLLTFEFLFDPAAAADRVVSRPGFEVSEELAPATVNTTSSRLPCCST